MHEENTEDFFKILIKKSYALFDILEEYVFKYRTFICAALQYMSCRFKVIYCLNCDLTLLAAKQALKV